MNTRSLLFMGALVVAVGLGSALYLSGCEAEMGNQVLDGGGTHGDGSSPPPKCEGGEDKDGDGYGKGCPAGDDCDETDPKVNDGAAEVCDGKDNDCNGKVDDGIGGCEVIGGGSGNGGNGTPFPTDKNKDPNLKDSTGVKLDDNGDLILGSSEVNFRYLWIANTYDMLGSSTCRSSGTTTACRGTVSKVNVQTMKEVGRYYTVTCKSKPGATSCVDVNGKPINIDHNHTPSRTAVDFNMDVWVANRNVHGGQQAATKIAADVIDCIDRNNNGKIDTSTDHNGDGQIEIDCNGDNLPDSLATQCTGGTPPEFLGDDDECILFTTNYGEKDDVGRSVCLDAGKSTIGASNAWVGTFFREENGRGPNKFFKINGYTGQIEKEVTIVAGHHTYGCMADAHNIVWSTDIGSEDDGKKWNGSLTYFETIQPYRVGKLLRGPNTANHWKDKSGEYHHYGISINADQHVWLGGWKSAWVLRFKPDRSSFENLHKGKWTRVDIPNGWYTRGVNADLRGKIWVGIHQGGYVLRLDQSLPDGVHDKTGLQLNQGYWKVTADTVIGVGVDFDGNIWGVGHSNDIASRLDVDKNGNITDNASGTKNNVKIGRNPYTYSDFTGYGLMNFVRPQGRWSYLHTPCPSGQKATWKKVTWNATTPPGTSVKLRVRSGDSETTFGSWTQPFGTSPADISGVQPNPSTMLQVEFTLESKDKTHTPTLHDYGITYTCLSIAG